jgi:hypothetical protein
MVRLGCTPAPIQQPCMLGAALVTARRLAADQQLRIYARMSQRGAAFLLGVTSSSGGNQSPGACMSGNVIRITAFVSDMARHRTPR